MFFLVFFVAIKCHSAFLSSFAILNPVLLRIRSNFWICTLSILLCLHLVGDWLNHTRMVTAHLLKRTFLKKLYSEFVFRIQIFISSLKCGNTSKRNPEFSLKNSLSLANSLAAQTWPDFKIFGFYCSLLISVINYIPRVWISAWVIKNLLLSKC